MKCRIIEKNGLIAKASDEDNNIINVWYASIFEGQEIEVEKDKDNYYIPKVFNYKDRDILSKYENKDGLIELSELTEITDYHTRFYEIDGYWFIIPREIKKVMEYIYENNLIEGVFIKLEKYSSKSLSSAPIINVNYDKMFKKVIDKRKFSTACYYCDKNIRDLGRGIYADFYVKSDLKDKHRIQFQLWQVLGEEPQVLYTHFIKNIDTDTFEHFDLSTHFVKNSFDIAKIFINEKMDICKKKKWIKNDTNLSEEHIFNITKLFFPMDDLVDEFLCEEK